MSTIHEKLTASKNGLDALLAYANGVTGGADANIGDAIRTLADGYGQGGGGVYAELLMLILLSITLLTRLQTLLMSIVAC